MYLCCVPHSCVLYIFQQNELPFWMDKREGGSIVILPFLDKYDRILWDNIDWWGKTYVLNILIKF